MAINNNAQRGFVLLVAVIFMSVMLFFGLALSSLAYKQQVLASESIQSQYAFYAADAALECALYADQRQGLFAFTAEVNAPAPLMMCDNATPVSAVVLSHTASEWAIATRLSLDAGMHCADVTIYKPAPNMGSTLLFSQGYDVSCAAMSAPSGVRFVARGLHARYGTVVPPSLPDGQLAYNVPGTYSFVVPDGVTSVSVVAVGGGGQGGSYSSSGGGGALAYKNNIPVIPGHSYSVVVGAGGAGGLSYTQVGDSTSGGSGGDSSFNGTLVAHGGFGNSAPGTRQISGSDGGGDGGRGGGAGGSVGPGGGGAGGYSGDGGNGGTGNGSGGATAGAAGAGGAGAGGGAVPGVGGTGGGGVGVLGQGSNGVPAVGAAGSGGSGGTDGSNNVGGVGGPGGSYGAGGATSYPDAGAIGAGGAVRIIWPGDVRSFPSTRTADE